MIESVAIVCLTGLIAQYVHYWNQERTRIQSKDLQEIFERIRVLERVKATQYDHAAFEELKGKVEAIRIAQGFKRG